MSAKNAKRPVLFAFAAPNSMVNVGGDIDLFSLTPSLLDLVTAKRQTDIDGRAMTMSSQLLH